MREQFATPNTTQSNLVSVVMTGAAGSVTGSIPFEYMARSANVTAPDGNVFSIGTNLDTIAVLDYLGACVTAGAAAVNYTIQVWDGTNPYAKITGNVPANGNDTIYMPFNQGLPLKALITATAALAGNTTTHVTGKTAGSVATTALKYSIALSTAASGDFFIGSHLESPTNRAN